MLECDEFVAAKVKINLQQEICLIQEIYQPQQEKFFKSKKNINVKNEIKQIQKLYKIASQKPYNQQLWQIYKSQKQQRKTDKQFISSMDQIQQKQKQEFTTPFSGSKGFESDQNRQSTGFINTPNFALENTGIMMNIEQDEKIFLSSFTNFQSEKNNWNFNPFVS